VRRHELDLTSLVTGVVFVAVGAVFLTDLVVDIALDPRWLAPLVLIAVGLAGLLSSMPVRRPAPARDDDAADVDATDETVDDPLTPR
jgi:hypothetical protein